MEVKEHFSWEKVNVGLLPVKRLSWVILQWIHVTFRDCIILASWTRLRAPDAGRMGWGAS